MKKINIALLIISLLILLSAIYIYGAKGDMVIFKGSFVESDLKVNNFVIISDGKNTYVTEGLSFTNISNKNISNVKFIVKNDNDIILDALFNMDNMKNYVIDQDRLNNGMKLEKSDVLTVEIEYSVDDSDRKSTILMNVSDYILSKD